MAQAVDVAEDIKRPIGEAENKARLELFRRITADLAEANRETPLPDDFIDRVKGRSCLQTVTIQP